jgi:hypothetical protein
MVGCGENGVLGVEKYGFSCEHFIGIRNAQGLLGNIKLETGQPWWGVERMGFWGWRNMDFHVNIS